MSKTNHTALILIFDSFLAIDLIHQRTPRREDRLQNRTVYIKGELYTLLSRLGSGKFASVWKSTTRDGIDR